MDATKISAELKQQRRTVAFDTYDITAKQLLDMVAEGQIRVAPDYQRRFVWKADRESALIESVFLGIPVPSLFMATNDDSVRRQNIMRRWLRKLAEYRPRHWVNVTRRACG
ncbi:DUF262 domain-containing protein, partial [Paracoccus saliphilus]